MPKFSSGASFKDAQESNNLYAVALKRPSISDKLVLQDTQYSTKWITNALSAIKPLDVGSSSHKWAVLGRPQDTSTATGTASSTGSGNALFTIEFYDNYANPYDVITFKSQVQAHVLDGGTRSANGWTYQCRLAGSATAALLATDYANNTTVGRGWSTFKEDSERGYGTTKYPDWYINYTSTARLSSSMTGDWLTDITWIKDSKGKDFLWYYRKLETDKDLFNYQREKKLKFAHCNMDANGNCLVPDLDGNYLPQGSGTIEQIDGINTQSYGTVLNATTLRDFAYAFAQRASLREGDNVMVECGLQGMKQWENAAELKYLLTGTFKQDIHGGTAVKIGNTYKTWDIGGIFYSVVHNPVKDDPQFNVNLNPDGFSKEANNFDFYAVTQADGSPNISRYVKAAGDFDRGMIMKEVSGMMTTGGVVGTSNDAKRFEFLTEEMVVIENPKRCGRLLQS